MSLARQMKRCRLAVASALLVPALSLAAQPGPPAGAPPSAPDTSQAGAVRVFVDCQSNRCDFDFFRDQMRWVNFVRDRLYSDVLLLVTSLRTGAGGTEYTIAALGNDRYRGRADTAVVIANPNDADDVVRRQLARTFGLLLAPYAARTPLASRIDMTFRAPTGAPASPRGVKDPWNFWIYRISANGFGSGEKRQTFRYGFLNASASRVTAGWKMGVGANLGYDESKFRVSDTTTFTNLLRNYGGNAMITRAIGGHWAAGMVVSGAYSDYNNYRMNLRVQPAVEWNYFDYKDFTRRQLTAFYSVGVVHNDYKQTTVYGVTDETRPLQSMTLSWNARQPWGSVNAQLFGSQFLHDLDKNSYGVSSYVDLRIAKGLAFNFGGSYTRVNDQLYLPRGELSESEVIARQQALATNYRFNVNFGLSYTFGSIYNTVVNPRFNAGRGVSVSY
ncbi:MAG: hypothetical protein LCH84_06255 [Gemmatimonadetes bacterium]|nr:hypothetical protein [Gemmatimonadota bacterium]